MSEVAKPSSTRIDQLTSTPAVRADRWRVLTSAASAWADGRGKAEHVKSAFKELAVIEEFHAFPGPRLIAAFGDAIDKGDAKAVASMARRIGVSMISRSYRDDPGEWEGPEDQTSAPDLMPVGQAAHRRPYFEALVVSGALPSRWPALADEMRKFRRPEDAFVYEPVFVSSFEDAICAVLLNPSIIAALVHEEFAIHSRHDAPLLRQLVTPELENAGPEKSSLALCRVLRRVRPDLDVYLSSDRSVERIAGDESTEGIRRVFYALEEPMEVHLSILEGVQDRYSTPFFDNLKKYAQRPIGTFHALPIARGKSVFKSEWIRDMGDFYGLNLFLAESSATTGGLDSMLEPTGNIKKAQEMAARAFGCDQVFFVTNGTSTSNKMVLQALCKPGDIVILDRNCHKSHHYGCVLSGARPLYVEAFPLTEYSMYGAVPLATVKKAMLDLKDEGLLDQLRLIDLTNCTFDGHMYNTRRVMEECLAIKPDVIFLWDEAWSGFARWSPFLRPRTGMGAAADIEAHLRTPEAQAAYDAQKKVLGDKPTAETLLKTWLVPDPSKVRLRVYQTNSTHKSMSAIRQGSMVLVKDVDHGPIAAQFREAVFTHASTSPNQQLIASLDVARRQMELEGYGLVANAIEVALSIRREIKAHPLISKYFSVAGADKMIPATYRQSGFVDYMSADANWLSVMKSVREDEFFLDPTRLTLVCGTAGFDGTEFKGLLASEYDIQVNKTSRNSVLVQSNINNTRSDVAHLIRVLAEICGKIERRLKDGGPEGRKQFEARVKSLMTDVPDLPNFSEFHAAFRKGSGKKTPEGDMRPAFYCAYDAEGCEYLPITGAECDKRLKSGPAMVSANFVIPYPPGFPILVPGQVVTQATIDFMRKLDVKEVHGYERQRGLKLIRPSVLEKN